MEMILKLLFPSGPIKPGFAQQNIYIVKHKRHWFQYLLCTQRVCVPILTPAVIKGYTCNTMQLESKYCIDQFNHCFL